MSVHRNYQALAFLKLFCNINQSSVIPRVEDVIAKMFFENIPNERMRHYPAAAMTDNYLGVIIDWQGAHRTLKRR